MALRVQRSHMLQPSEHLRGVARLWERQYHPHRVWDGRFGFRTCSFPLEELSTKGVSWGELRDLLRTGPISGKMSSGLVTTGSI